MDIYKLSDGYIPLYILVRPQDLDEEDSKQISVKKLLRMGGLLCSLTRERLSSQMKEKIYTTMLCMRNKNRAFEKALEMVFGCSCFIPL